MCNLTLVVDPPDASVFVDKEFLPGRKKSIMQNIRYTILVEAEGYDPNLTSIVPTTKEMNLPIILKKKIEIPWVYLLALIMPLLIIILYYDKYKEILYRFLRYDKRMKHQGIELYRSGKYDEALKKLDRVIKISPDCIEALYYIGKTLIRLGQYKNAKDVLDKAKEKDSQCAEAWERIGFTFYMQGEYDKAIQYYDRALEINPSYALAWYNKALALSRKMNNEDAEAAFAKARKLWEKR